MHSLLRQSGCSAVGSALRSGRRGRAFESPHPDTKRQAVKIACRFCFIMIQTALSGLSLHFIQRFWLNKNSAGTGFNGGTGTLSQSRRCYIQHKVRQSRPFTDFQYLSVFPSEFSVLPQKINENLQRGSASDANTREIRTLLKTLDINNLYSRVIFSSYEMHHFGT